MNHLFDMALPEGLEGLRMDRPEVIKRALQASDLISSADDLCGLPNHERYLTYKAYQFGLRQMPRDRLRLFLTHYQPGAIEFQVIRIPDRFFWLYYLVRPVWKLKRIIRREEVISSDGQTAPPLGHGQTRQ